jgi:hypothetical protein
MKKIILLSLLHLSVCAYAQVSFDFEDGKATGWIFNLPGRWSADNISPINGLYSLHHAYNNSESSSDAAMFAVAGLCPACDTVTWAFTVRHGADPSSSNRWSFILLSDIGPEEISAGAPCNGFAVGVNLAGYDDTLRLWHLSGGKASAVVTTDVNWQVDIGTDSAAVIRVVRSRAGEWTLEVAWSMDAEAQGKGSGYDPVLHEGRYAGIVYTYTSTRDMLFWIDDVSVDGVFIVDTMPPSVISVTALDGYVLQVTFDEDPDASLAAEGNISLSGATEIREVVRVKPAIWHVYLKDEIPNRVPDVLSVNRLCDQSGNCSLSILFSFVPVYAVTGDVVITEIMADPSPPVRLPEKEYLEITNRTADSLYAGGWRLIAGKDTVLLPPAWVRVEEKIILCSAADEKEFAAYGRTLGMTSFPSLNDTGETIALRDAGGSLLHAVAYSPAFFDDGPRSGGGWSAEMTDPGNPFNEPDVWTASLDPSGGTPGRSNSVEITKEDIQCPEVIALWPVATDKIRIVFSETVMSPGEGKWVLDNKEALSAVSDDIADRALVITLSDELMPCMISTLLIPLSVTDFAGNMPCVTVLRTGIASHPMTGEILFNELLFNPVPGCSDYAELYNNADRIFDLSELFIANGTNAPVMPVAGVPRQLLPGEYIALTTDREALLGHYHCADRQAVYETGRLPSMPDDKGSLVLYDHELNIIDRVDYTSSMHLVFLSGTEGIALEKVSPDLPSAVAANWHSASQACDWGTPGTENSVLVDSREERIGMTLSSSRVSPDCDGFEDVMSVDVYPGGDDNIITVTIFNDRGFIVKQLAERFVAGEGSRFVWDGTGDNGRRLPAGLYMIMAETYNTQGVTRRWKDVCALLYR